MCHDKMRSEKKTNNVRYGTTKLRKNQNARSKVNKYLEIFEADIIKQAVMKQTKKKL